MNSYTKVLISAMAAFATQAEASGIHNSCLTLSDTTIGQPDFVQTFMTNESQLTDQVNSNMQVDGFWTCTEGDQVVGLQFFLSETPFLEDQYSSLLHLDPIGKLTGNCGSLRLSGPIDKIKAASKSNKGVRGLEFFYEDKKVKIGDMNGWKVDTQKWKFTEDQALYGVYGESSPNGIEKLGFITLDRQCQAAIDASGPVEEEEEDFTGETVIIDLIPSNDANIIPDDANEVDVNIIPNDTNEVSTEVTVDVTVNESTDSGSSMVNFDRLDNIESLEPIEEPKEEKGAAVSTYLIAIFATIGVLLMVVLTVVALRRGMKAKGENHHITTTDAPATLRENKPANDLENSNGYTSGAAFQSPDQSKH
jgi:hypothetical protein